MFGLSLRNPGFLGLVGSSGYNVFFDNFEADTGWTAVGSGFFQGTSTANAYSGSSSLIRSSGVNNNGEYKLFSSRVNRGWRLNAWIYSGSNGRSNPDDTIAVTNSSGNGYAVISSQTTLSINPTVGYAQQSAIAIMNLTRTNSVWYRLELISNLDNSFTANRFDINGNLLGTVTSAANTSYNSFDRVGVFGGWTYYVDDLDVSAFSNTNLDTIQIIASNGVGAGNTSVPVPTHAAGDMLLVATGNQSTTPPTLLSGYTNVTSQGSTASAVTRSFRVQYIIDNTNTISSVSCPTGYASVFVIRGGLSVRQSNVRFGTLQSTILPIPALTNADVTGRNLILAGSYLGTFTNQQNPTGFTAIENEGSYIANNTSASTPSNSNFTLTANGNPLTWIVEIQ